MEAKNSRQELEIEYRRQCVKDAWIKLGVFDVTQQQIADTLAEDCKIVVDQSTISRDLKVIKQRIKDQTADEMKTELWAAYMRVVSEARQAWKRSLEDAVTETSEMIEVPEVAKGEKGNSTVVNQQRLKASTRREGQSGNPALLAQEQAAYKAMREMFGIDAAEKLEHSGPKGGPIEFTEVVVNVKRDNEPVED